MTGGIWAVAVVIIVAIIAFTEMQKAKHRARNGITLDWMGGEKPVERSDPALQREVEELRERIKVLERIATEDRETKLLSAEIESLQIGGARLQDHLILVGMTEPVRVFPIAPIGRAAARLDIRRPTRIGP